MIRCITIDDEPLALAQIKAYVSKISFLDHIAEFTNAIEAQQFLAEESVDLHQYARPHRYRFRAFA